MTEDKNLKTEEFDLLFNVPPEVAVADGGGV